jgi:AraC family transcriptional regulator
MNHLLGFWHREVSRFREIFINFQTPSKVIKSLKEGLFHLKLLILQGQSIYYFIIFFITLFMYLRAEIISEKKLIGKRLKMSFSNDKTGELWQSFMSRRREILNNLSTDLLSLQIYDENFFKNYNPNTEFVKWALSEVSDFDNVPESMEVFTLQGGLYAVFLHRNVTSTPEKTFGYIYGFWIPNSAYELDNRPHFEVLGEKYKYNDVSSEEEVWIPVRLKG